MAADNDNELPPLSPDEVKRLYEEHCAVLSETVSAICAGRPNIAVLWMIGSIAGRILAQTTVQSDEAENEIMNTIREAARISERVQRARNSGISPEEMARPN